MRIAIFGTGYVGLVTGTCFAEMGNAVTCVDVDADKVARLKRGEIPIYEAGLHELLEENARGQRLRFTTSAAEGLAEAEIAFICVGTPRAHTGEADLRYVEAAARDIGRHLGGYCLVVDKSTVPVGTADRVRGWVREELDKRGARHGFDVASNPEFLKEGSAVEDFMKPDRVVVGVDSPRAEALLHDLYAPFIRNGLRFYTMDLRSAEMTKYAANSMLATKISFMNEIANLCELVGADVRAVRQGMGADQRIGLQFLYPGVGYGGSCFPKDVRALVQTALAAGYEPELLRAVDRINDRQKTVIQRKLAAWCELNGRKLVRPHRGGLGPGLQAQHRRRARGPGGSTIGRDVAFFTNAILCLKNEQGGLQGKVQPSWFQNCVSFLRRQIEIVRPLVVVGLGERAYRAILEGFGMRCGSFRPEVNSVAGRLLPNGSRAFAVYHCGKRIQNTHRPMAIQREDGKGWDPIRCRRTSRCSRKPVPLAAAERYVMVAQRRWNVSDFHKMIIYWHENVSTKHDFLFARSRAKRQHAICWTKKRGGSQQTTFNSFSSTATQNGCLRIGTPSNLMIMRPIHDCGPHLWETIKSACLSRLIN